MTKKVNVFAVSMIALMTATAARADIASKAYVDQQIQPVETAISTHAANGDIHVTAEQKTAWSNKQDALGYTAENAGNKVQVIDYEQLTSDQKSSTTLYPSMKTTAEMVKEANDTLTSLVSNLNTNKIDKTVANDANSVMVRGTGGTYVAGSGNDISVAGSGAITVNHATKADQDGNGANIANTYATKTELSGATTDISGLETRMGTAEGNITTLMGADTVAGSVAKAEKDAKAYADSLAGNYATSAQGAKADTAVQPGDIGTAAEKDFTTSVSENGTGLPTAGAVYSAIAAAQTAATYDDTALAARVTANEGAITTLNGNASTSGSVANSIANALEDYTLKSVTASSGDGVVTSVSQSGSAVVSTKQKITSSHIASDAGILSSQLASGVQTTLTNAAADHTTISGYGDIVTHNASEFATNQFVGTIPSGSQATTVTGYVAEVAGTAGSALQSVTANNNAGVVTNIAKDGTAVTMTKAKVTGADIADNANIAATQLASGVQTSLGYADAYHTASATYGDIITHDASEFASAAADGAVMTVTTDDSTGNVVTAVSANNNGTVTVTKGITAIPKPSGNCTDCVLHYAGASGEFSWEEVGR